MKANRLGLSLLTSPGSVVLELAAQQDGTDRKLRADPHAKAEKGDAQSKCEFGTAFDKGSLGVTKDEVKAV